MIVRELGLQRVDQPGHAAANRLEQRAVVGRRQSPLRPRRPRARAVRRRGGASGRPARCAAGDRTRRPPIRRRAGRRRGPSRGRTPAAGSPRRHRARPRAFPGTRGNGRDSRPAPRAPARPVGAGASAASAAAGGTDGAVAVIALAVVTRPAARAAALDPVRCRRLAPGRAARLSCSGRGCYGHHGWLLSARADGRGRPAITAGVREKVAFVVDRARLASSSGQEANHGDQEAESLPELQRHGREGHQALREGAGREGRERHAAGRHARRPAARRPRPRTASCTPCCTSATAS